jgi:hypothetical protein
MTDTLINRLSPFLDEEHKEVKVVRLTNQLLTESWEKEARSFTLTNKGEEGLQVQVTYQDQEPETIYLPQNVANAVLARVKIMSELDLGKEARKQSNEMVLCTPFNGEGYDRTTHNYKQQITYQVDFTCQEGSPVCQIDLISIDLYQQELVENLLNQEELSLYHQAQASIEEFYKNMDLEGALSDKEMDVLNLAVGRTKETEVLVKTLYEKSKN